MLIASLLLANDYYRRFGPDISDVPAQVHGVIDKADELRFEDFKEFL